MNCQSCGEPMGAVSIMKSTPKRKYKIVKYHCAWCDITESSTSGDELFNQIAKEDVDKMYKNQEDNNV